MQLLEYFMWKDKSCGQMNHIATMLAFIVLLIQPIAVLIGAYFFGDLLFNRNKLAPIIWIYAINWINFGSKKRLCSRPNGIHVDWDFKTVMKIFWIMYYAVVILFFISQKWYLGVIVGILLIGRYVKSHKSQVIIY